MLVYSVKIPVNEYKYQLLTATLGQSPYRANPRRSIDKIIMASFIDKHNKPLRICKDQGLIYEIELPRRWIERYNISFITDESINDLIDTLEQKFKNELYAYIDGVLEFKESYYKLHKTKLVARMKDAATNFLHKNGFNEETLKFETVKKGYQRYKLKGKTIEK